MLRLMIVLLLVTALVVALGLVVRVESGIVSIRIDGTSDTSLGIRDAVEKNLCDDED